MAAAQGVSNQQLWALRRGEPGPEERIDLHGLRSDAVGPLLARRFESAAVRGLRCLLVIHGKGAGAGSDEGILRERLPGWLTRMPASRHVLAFAPAPAKHGGDGATLVLLTKA